MIAHVWSKRRKIMNNRPVFKITDSLDKLCVSKLISSRAATGLLYRFGKDGIILDLMCATQRQLYSIPNMGDKCVKEVIKFISDGNIADTISIPNSSNEEIEKFITDTCSDEKRRDVLKRHYLCDENVTAISKACHRAIPTVQAIINHYQNNLIGLMENGKFDDDLSALYCIRTMVTHHRSRMMTDNELTEEVVDRVRQVILNKYIRGELC